MDHGAQAQTRRRLREREAGSLGPFGERVVEDGEGRADLRFAVGNHERRLAQEIVVRRDPRPAHPEPHALVACDGRPCRRRDVQNAALGLAREVGARRELDRRARWTRPGRCGGGPRKRWARAHVRSVLMGIAAAAVGSQERHRRRSRRGRGSPLEEVRAAITHEIDDLVVLLGPAGCGASVAVETFPAANEGDLAARAGEIRREIPGHEGRGQRCAGRRGGQSDEQRLARRERAGQGTRCSVREEPGPGRARVLDRPAGERLDRRAAVEELDVVVVVDVPASPVDLSDHDLRVGGVCQQQEKENAPPLLTAQPSADPVEPAEADRPGERGRCTRRARHERSGPPDSP